MDLVASPNVPEATNTEQDRYLVDISVQNPGEQLTPEYLGCVERNGMLVRDRIAMEQARELDAIIFDKTGTLTESEHGVVGMETLDGVDEAEAFTLAAAVEGDSEHMIARAIRQAAEERDIDPPDAWDFEALKGRGVRATVAGQEVYVGGPNLLDHLDADIPDSLAAFADEAGGNAQTVVYLVRG